MEGKSSAQGGVHSALTKACRRISSSRVGQVTKLELRRNTTLMTRHYNFCAGPAALPTPVLERAREELLDY
ncbi:MAG: hypothetical protein LPK08_02170, partial [Halomonas sp.]|nr:hypothetical protein [Halomonas sp.]